MSITWRVDSTYSGRYSIHLDSTHTEFDLCMDVKWTGCVWFSCSEETDASEVHICAFTEWLKHLQEGFEIAKAYFYSEGDGDPWNIAPLAEAEVPQALERAQQRIDAKG